MIELNLTVAEVNSIITMLGRQPYEQVDGFIAQIRAQGIPQLPKPEVEAKE